MDLGFAGVILGAVIAGAVSIGGEWLRSKHESDLDGAKRASDPQIDRDNFQRETMLALQICIGDFLRAEGRRVVADVMAIRKTGGLTLLPEDVNAELFEANRQLGILTDRVTDRDLRVRVRAFRERVSELSTERTVRHREVTEAVLNGDMNEMLKLANPVQRHLL